MYVEEAIKMVLVKGACKWFAADYYDNDNDNSLADVWGKVTQSECICTFSMLFLEYVNASYEYKQNIVPYAVW